MTQQTKMNIEKKETQIVYTWTDDLGIHQYHCEDLGFDLDPNSFRDFERKKLSTSLDNEVTLYCWNDNFGNHQYFFLKDQKIMYCYQDEALKESEKELEVNIYSPKIKIVKSGTQYLYSWSDDLGIHQYYCEDLGYDQDCIKDSVKDFVRTKTSNEVMYTWNDNFGYHQYYLDL
jgi:hypothetical protein